MRREVLKHGVVFLRLPAATPGSEIFKGWRTRVALPIRKDPAIPGRKYMTRIVKPEIAELWLFR